MWIRAARIPFVEGTVLILSGLVAESLSVAESGFQLNDTVLGAVLALALFGWRYRDLRRHQRERLEGASEISAPQSPASPFRCVRLRIAALTATAVLVVVVSATTALPLGVIAVAFGVVDVLETVSTSRWEAAQDRQLFRYVGQAGGPRRIGWIPNPAGHEISGTND